MTEFTTEGIVVEDGDVEVDISVKGDEKAAETVMLHIHDEAVKALNAVSEGKHPDDCDGYIVRPDWDARLEKIAGDSE